MVRRIALLVVGLGLGCSRPSSPPTPSPSTQPQDLERLLAQYSPPPPRDLAITIGPDTVAWDTGGDVWLIEATITLLNRGNSPLEVDTSRLRLRDQAHLLLNNAMPGSSLGPVTIPPQGSHSIRVMAAPIRPGDRGQPTTLRVDYGTIGGMTPEVSAPVTAHASRGLVATFRDPSPPASVGRPVVGSRPQEFAWQVRLVAELRNPTTVRVRLPFGLLSASREDGSPSYWGDAAGMVCPIEWFSPGQSSTCEVTLMFPHTPAAPRRVMLSYADGPGQALDLPPAP